MSQYPGNAPRRIRDLTPEQRQRILKKRRMRRLKKRLMIIVPIVLVAVIALVLILTLTGGNEDVSITGKNIDEVQATVEATSTPAPTATPEPVVEYFNYDESYVAAMRGETTGPVLVPDYSKVDPNMRGRWPETAEGLMPVVYRAATDEKIIAVTVDDCFQGENLRQIIQCALDNNAKLTIFPIGDQLEKASVASAIKWGWENGMEIENHTYNHVGMYHFDDERMTSEMWYQNAKVSQVLGVNYQMHFFRPKGGDERNDQRVHAYANQLGYNAIAIWTQSGSTDSLESLYANLAPGKIYLWHTTDNDLNKLLQFIPYAVSQGYRLVTLNEMFGLPANETSDYSTVGTKPDLASFAIKPQYLRATTYERAAAVVQKRLIELGWLEGEADGVFGRSSAFGIGFFQMASGINPTAEADAETQRALFADNAPTGTPEKIAEFKKQRGLS